MIWLSICHRYLLHDMHHNICEGSYSIPCFCWFMHLLLWSNIDGGGFFSSMNVLSWLHDGFMWMVHEIFHSMFESKKGRLCWWIHIATEAHCEILKIIASLDSGLNKSTNPMILGSSMWFLNLFQLFSNNRCSHEECMIKEVIYCK